MTDPMPTRRPIYYVDSREPDGEWTPRTRGLTALGWAVSAMNRRADAQPALDWRVRSGEQTYRLRPAGQPRANEVTEAPAHARTMTAEQAWRRLPSAPEDDPF